MLEQENKKEVNDFGDEEETTDNNRSGTQTQTQSRTNDGKPLLDGVVFVSTANSKNPGGSKVPMEYRLMFCINFNFKKWLRQLTRFMPITRCLQLIAVVPLLLYAEDFSRVEKTAVEISKFLFESIESIGPSKVLQVVTDNAANCKATGEEVEKSKFNLGLLKVAKTQFASHYILLKRLKDCREALATTIVLNSWRDWVRKVDENTRKNGHTVCETIRSDEFWDDVDHILEITKPIFLLIKFSDGEGAKMGELGGENDYRLHCLRFATPRFYDKTYLSTKAPSGIPRKDPNLDKEVMVGVIDAFKRISKNEEETQMLRVQYAKFHVKKELAVIAKIVLSQPVSSSSAERNWSTYSFIHSVKRNRLNTKRADKFSGSKVPVCNHCKVQFTSSYSRIHIHFFRPPLGKKAEIRRCNELIRDQEKYEALRRKLIAVVPLLLYAEDFSRVEKTAVEISKFLLEAIESIGPSKVLQVVTDNAANCKATGEEVEKVEKMTIALHCLRFATPRFYDKTYLSTKVPSGIPRKDPNLDKEVMVGVIDAFKRISKNEEETQMLRVQYAKFHVKKELAEIAKIVLSQPVSSFSAERNWSTYSFIHSMKRNRLNTKRADKLVFVHSNIRLISRFSESYKEEPSKKWDMNPESTYLEGSASRMEDMQWEDLYED
ncbi:hypothetical protein CTI12_AA463070 [Artemisia annua]|uniref:HAT C-terminal dimerisation domain-containing protein n=1 Tax=Artemisia annua TaxID=35608 RepID=A0A2U1LQQ9_ARTAN|nr:hypothetical protein CTI12_AA463070 [Artemisia annua]